MITPAHLILSNNTRNSIIARDKEHLEALILNETKIKGNNCDLNHIDVSLITDMSELFTYSYFKNDVNSWKPYSLEKCSLMFFKCNAPLPNWLEFEKFPHLGNALKAKDLSEHMENSLTNKTKATSIRKI